MDAVSDQADGFQVWIDVDEMGGSTLEAMANAIEEAAVVLICMSENYKNSNSCETGECHMLSHLQHTNYFNKQRASVKRHLHVPAQYIIIFILT